VLLQTQVGFVADCVGSEVQDAVAKLRTGEILLLENTRFHPEETANDPDFAAELASIGDVFVNDAFGSAHRAHASTEGVAHYLPAVAGFLMEKELNYLGAVLAEPERPFVAIIGGAKISDKIGVLKNLLERSDRLLIGGAMANTFLAAEGLDMGDSLVDDGALPFAAELRTQAGDQIVLPVDLVVANSFSEDAASKVVAIGEVPPGWRAMDIGQKTVERFRTALAGAKLVVWNGPMGVFEFKPFANGTVKLAEAVADSGAKTIVGGGDSAAAVKLAGVDDRISHVSTGGGASLKLLEGKSLPGVAILEERG
jgi:phosphoglycerate kinase